MSRVLLYSVFLLANGLFLLSGLPAGFWSNCSVVRFDLPEYSLDASICGRGWLLSSIEDVLLQASLYYNFALKIDLIDIKIVPTKPRIGEAN